MSKRKPENESDKEIGEVVEPVESAAEAVDVIRSRAERQLRRGRLSRLNDRIAGGPARPGEQQISRSPFVLGMCFVILGLAIVAGVFYFLLRTESESRQLENASKALEESRFSEAEDLYDKFLLDYPTGDSKEKAKVGLHTARVRGYTTSTGFSVDSAVAAQKCLDEFFRECRDFDEFQDERENLIRYSKRITEVAAKVAIDRVSQNALDASVGALDLLDRLTKDGGVTADKREELQTLQRQAAAEILKSDRLSTALETIRRTLGEDDTLGALSEYQGLIDRFDVLKEDKDFNKVLSEIRAKEVELVHAEDLGTDAFLSDPNLDRRPSLSLNRLTQVKSDLVSNGKPVFGSSGDVVYAVDFETGEPIWKRYIGGRAPFAPMQVDASSPALLLFHSGRNELMLVQQADGSLIWRQPIESAASSPPLILNQQIYVTTEAEKVGYLWQVALASGRAVRRVRFSQPVQGPPTVSRDGMSLIVPGRSAFVYTLSVQPLECRTASWLGYGEGSVRAPVVTMGDLFLLCENYSAEHSRLRPLELADDGQLVERDKPTQIPGQILDPCLLRGGELYVPSTPQRVTAFRVVDRPGEAALSEIGTNQLESAEFASMFLVAGPGGNLWMASTALRRFRVTQQAVLLDEAVVADGQNLYPTQVDDDSLLVSTSDPYSASVFFTRVNRESMTGVWQTVLSTNLVAAAQSTSGRSLIAISDFGSVFRIPVDRLDESGFHTTSFGSPIQLPDGLKDPVGGLELPDGRLAVWCRGKDRALWTVSAAGQFEQRWPPPPGMLEADPVPLAGGLVVASPSRLTLTARRQKADDYQVSRDLNAEASWKFLTSISDTQLIAINSDNQLVQIEYRKSPPHLAEVSVTSFDGDTDINTRPVAGGDYLCLTTADGRLLLLRSSTLQIVTERDLGAVVSHTMHIAADRLFVEVAQDQVEVFELNDELNSAGTFPKNSSRLVDTPLSLPSGGFLAAFTDGVVLNLDVTGMPVGEPTQLGQPLQRGPIAVGSSVVVLASDGSLFSLNDLVSN